MKESILKSEIKSACDILRRDDGTNATSDYMEQLSWMLFLKIYEKIEEQNEELAILEGKEYKNVIEPKFRWSNWASKDWIGNPKESLSEFVDNVDDVIESLKDNNGEFREEPLIYFINAILYL